MHDPVETPTRPLPTRITVTNLISLDQTVRVGVDSFSSKIHNAHVCYHILNNHTFTIPYPWFPVNFTTFLLGLHYNDS